MNNKLEEIECIISDVLEDAQISRNLYYKLMICLAKLHNCREMLISESSSSDDENSYVQHTIEMDKITKEVENAISLDHLNHFSTFPEVVISKNSAEFSTDLLLKYGIGEYIATMEEKNFNPLTRLGKKIFCVGKIYNDTELTADDINHLKNNTLKTKSNWIVPFMREKFILNMMTPLLTIFKVEEYLEYELLRFNNFIFVNNTYGDISNYAFYYLNATNGKTREWKMDCCLQYLLKDMRDHVIPYCIDIFRRIFKDRYGDNNYRESTYEDGDLCQLVCNIISLSKTKILGKFIQNIIINQASYVGDRKDKFDVTRPDIYQIKEFQNFEDEFDEHLKELFDDNIIKISSLLMLDL